MKQEWARVKQAWDSRSSAIYKAQRGVEQEAELRRMMAAFKKRREAFEEEHGRSPEPEEYCRLIAG